MKKVIYFYGPSDIKKHKGLSGLKAFARANRYQLRDASLSTVDGQIEKADQYKGSIPESYKEYIGSEEGSESGDDKGQTSGQTPVGNTASAQVGADVDPTA